MAAAMAIRWSLQLSMVPPDRPRLQRALGELSALVRRCAGCPNKGLSAFAEELERLTARWRDRLAP